MNILNGMSDIDLEIQFQTFLFKGNVLSSRNEIFKKNWKSEMSIISLFNGGNTKDSTIESSSLNRHKQR